MKFTFIKIVLLALLPLISFGSMGQPGSIKVMGMVVEEGSDGPVEYATVLIKDSQTDKLITGSTTKEDGSFIIMTKSSDFYLEVSFMGYNPKTIKDITIIGNKADIGRIEMDENSVALEEVVVRAEKSDMEFKLDKRVYNVGKDLSSTGASALEVLDNIPSVTVNIEGQISLRGSTGVQILINGKPSVLTNEGGGALSTLTAEMIEKVEVITNPSAKYDAEGTSGIINIVIKKDDRKGTNGSFSINTGYPHNHSFGLSLNRRSEKFNIFSQLGLGYRELPNNTKNENRDLVKNSVIKSEGQEFRNENFYNVILGTDYYINEKNVVTVSGHFAYEVEDQPSETLFRSEGGQISEWQRNETTEATNPKLQYEVQYKRDFEDHKDHTLLFSALGSFFGKDQSSIFKNTTIFGDDNDDEQQTRTNFGEGKYTFKLDYTKPVSDKVMIEVGSQYLINNVSNDFAVSELDLGAWVEIDSLSDIFEYDQNVLGVYGTGSYEGDVWGLKLGLRMENTDLQTLLKNSNQTNDQNFTNFFPSAHASYKFSQNYSLQAGYSRRIRRPRLWDLNPFFSPRNNFSIRAGNPDLLPEYSDSYEISNLMDFDKTSISFGVYHLYTEGVVEWISIFDNGISITKPMNIGTNQATGIEFNAKYNPIKALTINADINFNYFNRKGSFESKPIDFNGQRWTSRLTSKVKLPADFEVELNGFYNSKYRTVQGEVSGNIFTSLGLRKKVLKKKGVINFSIRDVFASRFRESITDQEDFYVYSRSQRGRFMTLGFSYGFGKGEAMEFSGGRRRH